MVMGRGAIVMAALIGACTPVERPPASQRAAEVVSTVEPVVELGGPVITVLRTRDHEVTIHGGDAGLRFTVADATGVVLASTISELEFSQRFPGVHARYEDAFAGERVMLDASARTRPDPSPQPW